MIVMEYINNGSLRNVLKNKNNFNWYNILYKLKDIIIGLATIHESKLVHCDLHDGNILNDKYNSCISDLGLCKPIEYFKSNKDIYGVIPYMAPEVLRGNRFTAASDIYSFAMIMWELTSRVPPFDDRPHDFHLSLSICKGERPEIIDGTPQCYIDLMKKCWHLDPLQRPTASELNIIFKNWWLKYDEKPETIEDEQLRNEIEEFLKVNKALEEKQNNDIASNSKPITKSHPQAYCTSRLLDFTKKLNDILEQEEGISQSIGKYYCIF
jgi:serine/threonine protein kinase